MAVVRATQTVPGVGVLGTVACVLFAGEPADPGWWSGVVPFGILAAVPCALAASMTRRFFGSRRAGFVICAAATRLASSSLFLLTEALVPRADPQSGQVVLFLPLWQCIGLAPSAALAFSVHRAGLRPETAPRRLGNPSLSRKRPAAGFRSVRGGQSRSADPRVRSTPPESSNRSRSGRCRCAAGKFVLWCPATA